MIRSTLVRWFTSANRRHQTAAPGRPAMKQRRLRIRPEIEAFEDRLCPSSTAVLPISAFLAQQGHDMVFTPPVRDQLGWTNSAFDPGTGNPTRFLLADFTGQEAQFL